jgi:hypothetical protein
MVVVTMYLVTSSIWSLISGRHAKQTDNAPQPGVEHSTASDAKIKEQPQRGDVRDQWEVSEDSISPFISYSSQDNAFAERLANDLKAKNLGVWFDKWEIRVGDSLMQRIGQGIRENDYLIVVLSPDSVASEWVKKELAEAMQREIAEKRVVVLPILYRQCQRPPFLTDKKYADFTKSYETGFQELVRGLDRQIG